tara:strand:+ start:397 stop:744 length:348 start_codon:yes stop_codon:yes gene_type:complete
MNSKYLLLGAFLFLLGHLGVFHQLNGQFKWEWFKNNPHILALAGIPISLLYIYGTKFAVQGFDGLLWPTRFLGFGIGMMVYAWGVSYYFSQGFTPKVVVSLILAFTLLSIQVLWK